MMVLVYNFDMALPNLSLDYKLLRISRNNDIKLEGLKFETRFFKK